MSEATSIERGGALGLSRLAEDRTVLCVPAHRQDRIAKARQAGADRVMVDLEDSLPSKFRGKVVVGELGLLPGEILRVASAEDRVELPEGALVMLPKVEDAGLLAEWLRDHPRRVIPCFESPRSLRILRQSGILHLSAALAFGRVDFRSCLPWRSSGAALRQGATEVTLAAAAAGVPAWDGPAMTLHPQGVMREVAESIEMGFTGKACVHPDQVQVVKDAFSRAEEDTASWAMAVPPGDAVFRDGEFFFGPGDQRMARSARGRL